MKDEAAAAAAAEAAAHVDEEADDYVRIDNEAMQELVESITDIDDLVLDREVVVESTPDWPRIPRIPFGDPHAGPPEYPIDTSSTLDEYEDRPKPHRQSALLRLGIEKSDEDVKRFKRNVIVSSTYDVAQHGDVDVDNDNNNNNNNNNDIDTLSVRAAVNGRTPRTGSGEGGWPVAADGRDNNKDNNKDNNSDNNNNNDRGRGRGRFRSRGMRWRSSSGRGRANFRVPPLPTRGKSAERWVPGRRVSQPAEFNITSNVVREWERRREEAEEMAVPAKPGPHLPADALRQYERSMSDTRARYEQLKLCKL